MEKEIERLKKEDDQNLNLPGGGTEQIPAGGPPKDNPIWVVPYPHYDYYRPNPYYGWKLTS